MRSNTLTRVSNNPGAVQYTPSNTATRSGLGLEAHSSETDNSSNPVNRLEYCL